MPSLTAKQNAEINAYERMRASLLNILIGVGAVPFAVLTATFSPLALLFPTFACEVFVWLATCTDVALSFDAVMLAGATAAILKAGAK